MNYVTNHTVLYGDTLLPDIFISEYMPGMEGDFLKVYLYLLFLSKHNKFATSFEISKKIHLSIERVKQAMLALESLGVLERKDDKKITLVDLKEKEITKLYRPKTTSQPSEVVENQQRNKKRNETMYAINETFFQGLMSPGWYTDIDAWFERFGFDEDVMYTLFHHCYENKGLFKNYIEKVAQNWFSRGIKTGIDLDKYYLEFQKIRDIRSKVVKKLKLARLLTEYEEDYLEKWCSQFQYTFDEIELALKKTTGRTSPSFNYIDTILSAWHASGLRTKEDIIKHLELDSSKGSKKSNEFSKSSDKSVPQHANFEQRSYAEDDFEKFYANLDD